MRIYSYIGLIILTFYTGFSQTVKGRIIDSDTNEPLIGAQAYLLNNWRKGAIADVDGQFELVLEPDELKDSLIISYVGFREIVLPIEMKMEILLDPIETKGETVIVTARPLIAEEFKYVEIRKLEIYTNPAAKADPILAVNSLPSATTTDESANISLRGSSPIETGIYFNNVPIYDAVRYSQLNGIGTFSIFNTDIIKNVTVFPGNPPLEFGNATSGIISMQTDDQILEGNSNSLILSLANVGISRQQRINEKNSLKLFSNWQPSGPIKMLNSEALEDIKSFTSNDLGVYYYGSTSQLSWKILGYGVTEGYRFNFSHPSFNGTFDQKKQRSFLITTIEHPLKMGAMTLNGGIGFSNGDYRYSNVHFNVKSRDVFFGLNYLLNKDKYSLKTGISYDSRSSLVVGNFHTFGYALGMEHPTNDVDEKTKVTVPEYFAYFKYFLSDHIAVGGGARKNLSLNDGKDYFSRQINFSYQKREWSLTFGAGFYNKNGFLENSGQVFQSESNQKSLDIKRSKGDLEIALSLFDKEGQVNDSKYTAKGSELYANFQITPDLAASGSVTLLDAKSGEESYIYDLSYFVRANISWNPAKFWTIETIVISRQGTLTNRVQNSSFDAELNVYEPVFGTNDFRLSPYINVGLSVSKVIEVSDEIGVIVFTSLNNVFNRDNIRGYEYNFDYSLRENSLFSLRTGYFGAVVNF